MDQAVSCRGDELDGVLVAGPKNCRCWPTFQLLAEVLLLRRAGYDEANAAGAQDGVLSSFEDAMVIAARGGGVVEFPSAGWIRLGHGHWRSPVAVMDGGCGPVGPLVMVPFRNRRSDPGVPCLAHRCARGNRRP